MVEAAIPRKRHILSRIPSFTIRPYLYSYPKILRVTLGMVTPIFLTLTGAAFLMLAPTISNQAYCSLESPAKAFTSLASESELRSQRHMLGRSDVIFRHISGSHMQWVLFLNARLRLTLRRIPHSQGYALARGI